MSALDLHHSTKIAPTYNQFAAFRSTQPKELRYSLRRIIHVGLLCILAISIATVFNSDWFANPHRLFDFNSKTRALLIEGGRTNWKNLDASRFLPYSPCYQDEDLAFQCAKLLLPLDPLNETETRQISVAVIRYPAPVNVTSKRYGGAFFLNPGGPGGDGVAWMAKKNGAVAKRSQMFVSDLSNPENEADGGPVYDIMSWDPRGVGQSTPSFSVYQSAIQRQDWDFERQELGFEFQYDNILRRHAAKQRAWSKMMRDALEDQPIGPFLTTTSVVRDMVALAEAHGRWRGEQAARILEGSGSPISKRVDKRKIEDRTRYRPGKERLNFWGFSYGTVLGQYFASMYPQRYNRLIIDGGGDVRDWVQPDKSGFLDGIDRFTEQFAEECFQAGPLQCHLWENAPGRILGTVNGFLKKLKDNGPISDVVDGVPVVAGISEFGQYLISIYYRPQTQFKNMDLTIWSALRGDLRPFVQRSGKTSCAAQELPDSSADAGQAVTCVDVVPANQWTDYATTENLRTVVARTFNYSTYLGGAGFGLLGSAACAALHDYELPQRLRYPGPFGFRHMEAWEGDENPRPILFASSAYDPMVPLALARRARENFPGSGHLINAGLGHCSTSWKSKCVEDTIRDYVATGQVDTNGEIWCAKEGHSEWGVGE